MRDAAPEPQPHAGTSKGDSILPVVAEGLVLVRGGRRILDRVDLTLAAGSGPLVIIGPNGAGKSMLLKTLAGLERLDGGCVHWGAAPPHRTRIHRLGFVLQRPVLLRRSVHANIAFALKTAGVHGRELEARAQAALDEAGLSALRDRPARLLSGGEQQRLALARALAIGPELLVLDEATTHLDPASTAAIEAQVVRAHARGTLVVLVTHDIAQARRLAREVIVMHKGRIIEASPADRFFARPDTPEARTLINGELVL